VVASYIINNGLQLASRREGAKTALKRPANAAGPPQANEGSEGHGMARRAKDDAGERRTALAAIHLTPSEYAELKTRADALNQSVSDFARMTVLSDVKKPAPNARDPRSIKALAVEISRVGNNVNQLAHVANERRAAPQERTLQEVSERIKAALEKVMQL
jgi:hypothetical protein